MWLYRVGSRCIDYNGPWASIISRRLSWYTVCRWHLAKYIYTALTYQELNSGIGLSCMLPMEQNWMVKIRSTYHGLSKTWSTKTMLIVGVFTKFHWLNNSTYPNRYLINNDIIASLTDNVNNPIRVIALLYCNTKKILIHSPSHTLTLYYIRHRWIRLSLIWHSMGWDIMLWHLHTTTGGRNKPLQS